MENLLDELAQDVSREVKKRRRRARRKPGDIECYSGMGIRTCVDDMGYEQPLTLSRSVIRRAPRLLREVAELWKDDGLAILAQQFIGAHVVVGSALPGCCVRQQENLYNTNLQMLVVAQSGSGKSKLAALDRLVEPIDHELRNSFQHRRQDYLRDQQMYQMDLSAWKQGGGKDACPQPPHEPLPTSLLMADDTTAAAVVRWLAGNDGSLSLMRHDELTTLMNSLNDRDNGGFTDLIKKGFDNARHVKQLRTDDEGYYIRRVGLALLISTTPDVMHRFLSPVYDDGTGSRLLAWFSPSSPTFAPTPPEETMVRHDDRMQELADRLYELYRAVRQWLDGHPGECLKLIISPQQEQLFTKHFTDLMTCYIALEGVGDEAISLVRRRAVDAKRILLIWSLCRKLEEIQRGAAGEVFLPNDGRITATDDDLLTVLELIDCLMNHCMFMLVSVKGIPQEPEEKLPRMYPVDQLRMLSKTFVTADIISTCDKMGVNRSTGYRRLKRWIGQGLVKEKADGTYEKTERGVSMTRRYAPKGWSV